MLKQSTTRIRNTTNAGLFSPVAGVFNYTFSERRSKEPASNFVWLILVDQ